WYLFRYMDAHNDSAFASQAALDYWQNVDLYIGGSEHATGHLLYSRFWTKFLKDRSFINVEEPFKKLINQGMILGESAFIYLYTPKTEQKVTKISQIKFGLKKWYAISETTYSKIQSNVLDEDVEGFYKKVDSDLGDQVVKTDYTLLKVNLDVSLLIGVSNEL